MKNKEVIEIIRESYSERSPDVLQNLRFDSIEKTKTKEIPVRRRYIAVAAVYIAACIVIVCILPFITSMKKDSGITPSGDVGSISSDTNTVPETTEQEADVVPPKKDHDFGGAEFKILHVGKEKQYDYWKTNVADMYARDIYLIPDEREGEMISSAVSKRNNTVEEEYNVRFVSETVEDLSKETLARMQAGQCDFNVILDEGVASKWYVTGLKGYLYDLREMENIDLTQSYWMPKASESLTVAGRQFFSGGMVTMDAVGHAEILYYNNDLMSELGYGDKTPADMVEMGSWTYERMLEMVVAAGKDLNGDGRITVDDRWNGLYEQYLKGIIINSSTALRDIGNGEYELVPYTSKTLDAYNRYANTIESAYRKDGNINLPVHGTYDVWYEDYFLRAPFEKGNTLFMLGSIDYARELSGVKGGYSIVPVPVLEEGDEYVARGDANSNMLSVPIDMADPYMTGAVLEYMAILSERMLYPAYINETLGTNVADNDNNYKMADVIKNSVRYDWAELYNWGSQYSSYGEYENMRMRLFDSGLHPEYELDEEKVMRPINTVVERLEKVGK
ncbi:MAG: hypothetical protein E7578_02190 [Ruminococcaceae bacterium]|nr:hypothetical protein [Oscillospiraceae bacterium]